ncbi:glycosyltransferase [Candidatus Nitrospira salsa]
MVAFHYPPFSGGSGVHRTLKFSRYLPQYQWRPIMLTPHVRAYPQTSDHQMNEIPSDVLIKRAFALDTARHLSFRGKYLNVLALPDRWVTWMIGAIPLGLWLIRKYQPQAIWSTYPIATAHGIGLVLSKLTGLPWIADFRDSMTEENYPRDRSTREYYQWIERNTFAQSTKNIFTAPSTKKMYLDRYPWLKQESCLVIPNGYDEHDFQSLQSEEVHIFGNGRPVRLIHAGVVYPEERDPRPFFQALAKLKSENLISSNMLQIEFRGSGSEDLYATKLQELDITDIVYLLPSLPYRQSLQDCMAADGLLLLQGATCNHQIPAKAYEYLRIQKPILALTDVTGDTAALLNECGGATICDLHDEEDLYQGIRIFLGQIKSGQHPIPHRPTVNKFSRESQSEMLATYLHHLTDSQGG